MDQKVDIEYRCSELSSHPYTCAMAHCIHTHEYESIHTYIKHTQNMTPYINVF